MYLSSQSYEEKYKKYKRRYQNLKIQLGGECLSLPNPEEEDFETENLLDLCPHERITIQNKCYKINSLYKWIIERNNEILPGTMRSISYEEKKRLIQGYEELQIYDFKIYINKNTIKTVNLKKNLNVYTFYVPRYDFNDVLYMIIDAIKLFQPNPEIYGNYDAPPYFTTYPAQYPVYKQRIINYVKQNLSNDNVMLPILEIFDYKRWSCRTRNLENLDDLIGYDIINKLGFDGLGRRYGDERYFYRTEPMR
jgi:hypothetical protein